ncbi:MAG: OB-fold nucleic acid binding domain-containing protein [Cyanosarcina radialis HA8281-LM2]|jgi:uncharacterized protein YdeI (BOF family)|nr:OB-fold nucleic acid binding domain-containing protein [Cyanosarcina radialis HA8281-LM2]
MKWKQYLALLLAGSGIASLAIAGVAQPRNLTLPTQVRDLAQAQTPPVQPQPTRIGDLRRTNGIAISGRVLSVVGNNFTLDDGSGQIIVDAGPRWYREVNLDSGEEVTVIGKLSEKSGEFDAFSIQRANGSTIEIRPAAGPPPWAGGPDGRKPRR